MKNTVLIASIIPLIGASFFAIQKNQEIQTIEDSLLEAENAVLYYKEKLSEQLKRAEEQKEKIQAIHIQMSQIKVDNNDLKIEKKSLIQNINQLEESARIDELEREKLLSEVFLLKKELLKDFKN
ncbi:MAG: hypothetical protein CBD09_01900 [Puniceicoccaceae bacterium TMED149]|nr:MAG: hypothetical protein CBD09_01900 [Puniceicoccaceae bacterium TMED149]|tara:strand:- start:6129 stop:6503 length:375 start_codon:yes stop_codon:yes gene_type:complete